VGLTACLLGLVLCGFPYLVVGRRDFSPSVYYLALPPFLLATGFLLWRYLAKPGAPPARPVPLLLAEAVSWIAIARFVVFVSAINLLVGIGRVGFVCQWFLLGAVISLPVVIRRRTSLEERLAAWPRPLAIAALLLILSLATAAVIADVLTPTKFL
jgi:hypothetical protein